jgi:hypothetical protein
MKGIREGISHESTEKADVLNEGIRPNACTLNISSHLGGGVRGILSGYISSGWTSLIGKETRAVGEEGLGSDSQGKTD